MLTVGIGLVVGVTLVVVRYKYFQLLICIPYYYSNIHIIDKCLPLL
jgi:hypothetical protein